LLLRQENDFLQSSTYKHFINAIKSPATQAAYENSLNRYLNHLKLKELDDLLVRASTPKYIETQIIDYIMSLRESGLAYATIQFLVAPIFTFYQLNDIVLNRKKVSRYLGEYKRVAKDGAYSTEQIQTALQTADARMRMILLTLSSTGCRVGALPSLKLGNLTKLPDYGLYRKPYLLRESAGLDQLCQVGIEIATKSTDPLRPIIFYALDSNQVSHSSLELL
jgi:integrase